VRASERASYRSTTPPPGVKALAPTRCFVVRANDVRVCALDSKKTHAAERCGLHLPLQKKERSKSTRWHKGGGAAHARSRVMVAVNTC
jgi:hypothetical protein